MTADPAAAPATNPDAFRPALRAVVEAFASELELEPLLLVIASQVCELLGTRAAVIGLYDAARGVARSAALHGMPAEAVGAEHTCGADLAGAVLRARRPVLYERYGAAAPPAYSSLAGNTVLAVPVLWREQLVGFFGLAALPPRRFAAADVETLELFARHAAIAIGNAGLFAGAQRSAVLEERQRLARDLHDSVTQMLASINMIAQSLTGAWRKDPSEGERRTERLAQLARSALAEMRALLKELRPAQQTGHSSEILLAGIVQLRLKGLGAALKGLATGLPPGSPAVSLELGAWEAQAPEHEEVLFRVAQEALTNAIRHSGARAVRIAAVVDDQQAVLTVRDDGHGFEPQAAAKAAAARGGGFGLQSMRERLEALGGSFQIRSKPQSGTTIDARLPARAGVRREDSSA